MTSAKQKKTGNLIYERFYREKKKTAEWEKGRMEKGSEINCELN